MNPNDRYGISESCLHLGAKLATLTNETLAEIGGPRIRAIWKNVSNGVGDHGSFLKAFGNSVNWADEWNFRALLPSAIFLIEKYELDKPEYWKEGP